MAAYEDGVWWSNDGLRLHYRAYAGPGDRPAILCLHGLTRNARDWEPVADRLAGDWRLFCLDMRGRGESAFAPDPMTYNALTYAQDIERFLRERNIERYISFGTSMGGIITMLMAGMRPERFAGVLLNDIGPEIEEAGLDRIRGYVSKGGQFPTWMHAAHHLREGFSDAYPNWDLEQWLAMAKRLCRLSSSGRISFDYDMRIAEPLKVAGGDTGIDMWAAFEGLKQTPATVVRGQLSDILSAETASEMRRRKPDLDIVEVAGVGHAPLLDEPQAQAAIDRLLERVSV